jgi:uncharacterized protein
MDGIIDYYIMFASIREHFRPCQLLLLHEFMIKIGLLSDTHGYIHPELPRIFSSCDEIWHAGDFGNYETALALRAIKPLRGVYGNIDGADIRHDFPEVARFQCEQVDVLITHIGGYPGHYQAKIPEIMKVNPPMLFISGHSHILKIQYDKKYNCLHLNPGAAGRHGFHKVFSMLRFTIDGPQIKDMEVVEFDRYKD